MIALFLIYAAVAVGIRWAGLALLGESVRHRKVTTAAVAVLWPCIGLLVVACMLADMVEWGRHAAFGHPDEVRP